MEISVKKIYWNGNTLVVDSLNPDGSEGDVFVFHNPEIKMDTALFPEIPLTLTVIAKSTIQKPK